MSSPLAMAAAPTRTDQVAPLGVLEVRLGSMLAGFLSRAGAVHRFTAAPTYLEMIDRPILSQQYRGASEPETRQRLTSERGSHAVALGRLPPFFANLLPEGPLRGRIIGPRAVAPDYEFDLLATAGGDLPGDVSVMPASSAPAALVRWHEAVAQGPIRVARVLPPVLGAFSLSGSQDKRLYVEQGGEFIAAPPGRGDWIAKFSPTARPDAAANELCATALAQAAGVKVATLKVVSAQLIDLDTDASEVLLARRIDRDVGTRTHIEDFAQVLGRFPEEKYCGADNYETVARIVNQLSVERLTDALEFTRRIVVSVLLGNGAMHLKNIALIYREGRACALAPAFDIAATTLANGEDRLALALAGERDMRRISEATFTEYAACAELPPKAVLRVVRDTVKRAREQWPSMLYTASLAVETKRQILGRLVQLPLVGK